MEQRVSPYIRTNYWALSDRALLGVQNDKGSGTSQLILATLPDYKEVARAPFSVTQEREALNRDTGLFISDGRKMFLYGVGHSIVCRRSSDLGILWTWQIEPEMVGVRSFSMTPDGGMVAAAVMDTTYIANQKNYYVGVYAGSDGSPVARLHLDGFESMAISPNGKMLAIGLRVALDGGEVQPTVNLYEVASGQQIGTVVHDRVRIRRQDFGNDAINAAFTSDGKFLITSGIHTKVWEL